MTQWSEDQIGALPFIGILVQEEDGEGKRDPESWKRGFTRGKRMRRSYEIESIYLYLKAKAGAGDRRKVKVPRYLHQQLFTTAVANISHFI